jgi:hypothetical protein
MMHDCPLPPTNHFHFPLSLGAIIKLPPNPGVDVAYKDLVCTESDKEKIIELFNTLADNNKFYLLLNQTYIRGIGAQLNHVHPLKLIAVSMATPHLKNCYRLIFEDYFKKLEVLGGMGASLTREADKGKLDQYLAPFAEEMSIPVEDLRPFTEARDWEGLVTYLMTH